MEVRQMAVAVLFHQEHVLMIKKSGNRLFDHEFWSFIGGHMEQGEMNAPMDACYREIREETGLLEKDILNLQLCYVLLRLKEDEIRQQFVYFGDTKTKKIISSNEGDVQWIHRADMLDRYMSRIVRFMVRHFMDRDERDTIYVGTITEGVTRGEPEMNWSVLKDPIVF